jgi:hypothetical protein
MDITSYIKPELFILVPALIGLGAILKKSEKVKDNFIPLILTVVSLVLSCLYVLGTEGISAVSVFTAIVQGLLCVATSVYGNQMFKQLTEKK